MTRVWIRGWLAWCGVLAVVLFVLVTFHAGARPAGATHLCGNTGSSQGAFDLRAYEDGSWRTTYSRTLVLAGLDRLFADVPGFDLPRLETGGRSAGSGQLTDPYIPPTLLKAIAWIESSWAQADYSVPYGSSGPVLVSHACAYGIAQVLSGMQNTTNVPTLDQAMIGGHYAFNIARGARILAEKWNAAPTYRPIVGNRDRTIVENWYYAVWSYSGFSFKNHPLNPGFSLPRSVYRCDGTQPRSNYPYQELIFGCMANPPVVGGAALWNPVAITLPNLFQPAFNLNSWNACSVSRDCAAMDLATPSPSHTDPTTTGLTRSQVIGSPSLSVSSGQITLVTVPSVQSTSASLVISNAGTGPLSWRASVSASWLRVSPAQGVALGADLGSQASAMTVQANPTGLLPGKYTAKLTIESLWASGAPATVTVTLRNYPDGTLLKGSGSKVFVTRGVLKRHIPNQTTFEAYSLNSSTILTIPDSVLDAIPTGEPLLDALADGNLLKGTGDEVYAMEGGLKRHVSSPSVLTDCGYSRDAVYVISDSRLSGIPTGAALLGSPCPHLSPPSGALIKEGSGDEVYVMRSGLKRHVRNPVTLEAQGFLWGNINGVPDSSLDAIPTGEPLLDALADGNLLKGTGDEVYAMEGGLKRHVSSPSALKDCGYGSDAVYVISDSRLSGIPTGAALSGPPCPHLSPPSGALIKGSSGDEVYVMRSGLKRHVRNPVTLEAYGYLWGNVDHIPDSSLAGVPSGESLLDALADGNLLKGTGDEVYAMEGGLKRHVSSPSALKDCGYGSDAVYVISDSRLEAISAGPALSGPPCPKLSFADGALLSGSGPEVYVMGGGSKRHIISREVFETCGYLWGDVNLIADSVLAAILVGESVTGVSCP